MGETLKEHFDLIVEDEQTKKKYYFAVITKPKELVIVVELTEPMIKIFNSIEESKEWKPSKLSNLKYIG